MQAHSLRAPKADGAILAEPPLASAVATLEANVARFDGWDHDFQGRRFPVLRDKARADAFDAARLYHEKAEIDLPGGYPPSGPIVVTGHQPELFHPGVWVKNFAIAAIASRAGGTALNLIVDNDIPRGAYIRVPERSKGDLRTRLVAFDDWTGEAPYEDQPIRDEGLFRSFPERVREVLGGLVDRPIIERFWSVAESAPTSMAGRDRVGLRFARARRMIEAEWGVRNLEVPLSDLCETDGFRWFACHLLAQLPRFQSVHNESLARYRALYHIRSKNHPVAALGRQGDWLEAPFWAWRASEPRRRPLLVRQLARTMELRIGGEDEAFLTLPLASDREACCAVEALRGLPERGIRLRTRALTTTIYARFLVGDLFVHGIGGAKYDELGDEIARGFFGVEPPAFLTLSMTLHLGLPIAPVGLENLHAAERRLRDLTWQPERLRGETTALAAIVAEKQRLATERPVTKAAKLARYRGLRRCNDALAVGLESQRVEAEVRRGAILAALRENELARSREYAFVLHDEARTRAAMGRVASLGPA